MIKLLKLVINIFSIMSVLLLAVVLVSAQDDVTVPDVTGLNIPQAAAVLNESGLRIGQQIAQPFTADAPQAPGAVVSQSIAAGSTIPFGTSVDLTLLTDSRLGLIYDDNDLTLINDAGATISLQGLVFSSTDGTTVYTATTWRANLEAGDCTQIWSIPRNQPKNIDGCDSIFWRTTNNTDNHFWTQVAGVTEFNVIQNGDVLATCQAAPPNSQDSPTTCEFYVVTDQTGAASTDYVYFSYTTDRFAVINNSTDSWMPLDNTPIYNFNPRITVPGVELILGDPALFPNVETVADIRRLAPGQCLMLTVSPLTDAEPPENCTVIAQRDLSSEVIFWSAPFELNSPFSTGGRATCPAATPDRVTRCIMPR